MLLLQKMLLEVFVSALEKALEIYLGETFGKPVCVETKRGDAGKLPVYIGQTYDLIRTTFLNRTLYLLLSKAGRRKPTPTEVALQANVVRNVLGENIAFVFSDLVPYERKRFIQVRVPFIVPGRQTYLPQYVVDLRERANASKNRCEVDETFRPPSGPAQVLLLFYLQRADLVGKWSLREWSKTLGYSTMTATRICDELVRCGLCRTETIGKKMLLVFDEDRRALWGKALPFLRSPVKRTGFAVRTDLSQLEWCHAGVSALSRYTLIDEGRSPVYAMSVSDYRRAVLDKLVVEQAYWDHGSIIIEQWRYRPKVLAHGQIVDRLSLYLSMRDEHDERIESALSELQEGVRW